MSKEDKKEGKKINLVCDKRLDKYFDITERALAKVKEGENAAIRKA